MVLKSGPQIVWTWLFLPHQGGRNGRASFPGTAASRETGDGWMSERPGEITAATRQNPARVAPSIRSTDSCWNRRR